MYVLIIATVFSSKKKKKIRIELSIDDIYRRVPAAERRGKKNFRFRSPNVSINLLLRRIKKKKVYAHIPPPSAVENIIGISRRRNDNNKNNIKSSTAFDIRKKN